MRKSKRAIAAILCVTAALSLGFTGCGNQQASGGAQAKVENDKVDENGKVNGIWYEKGLPIVDKESDFSVSIFCDDSSEKGEFYMMDQLKEQTNLNIDLQFFPNEVAKEKFSLAMSSGDYADAIGGWILNDGDILKYGVDQGIFIPLEDYIKKYCPNIQAVLDLPGVTEAMTAPDGHIYSIPYVSKAPKVDFGLAINTKWLKNVGMEMPTTTDEFKKVLQAFKEQDANGNGDPGDEIPLSFDPNNKHIGYLCGWFGMSVDDYGMTMKDGKLTFGANTEEFKNGILYLKDLYKEGLIDSEAFTQDLSQWKAKGGQDRFGVSMVYGSNDLIPYNPGEKPNFLPLPILSSPECDTPSYFQATDGKSVLKTQVVITDKAKEPGAILRWFDNAFTLENSAQIQAGPLDISIFKEGDGYKQVDTTKTLSAEDQAKYSWANLFPQSLPHYLPVDFQFVEDPPLYKEQDVRDAAYEKELTGEIPSYWVSLDDSSRLSELQTTLRDYMKQKIAEWVSGQADIEKEWDSYCKELDTLGLQDYIKIREKALETSQSAAE